MIHDNIEHLFRPTWATIDLDAIQYNYDVIADGLPKGVHVMAMVKADAYGHGAVPVARLLEKSGVKGFGVATVEEGVELRSSGLSSQIIVMGGLMGVGSPASQKMIEMNLTPVIHSEDVIESLETCAAEKGKRTAVHLKIDTGMSRLGIRPESLVRALAKLKECKNLYLEGVMTHLAEASEDCISDQQFQIFLECKLQIEKELGPIDIWHVANSEAAIRHKYVEVPNVKECWVRPGLSLYGECESFDPLDGKLKPVMGLNSKAVLIKRIPAGTRVSYCGIFQAKRDTKLAIVPIGYADGYPWSSTGSAQVLIRGKRVPVVGRVTMDMIIVDVTDIKDVEVNDEVVLLGRQGNEFISLREMSEWATTIPYEILCGISKRMPRVYRGL
ncbi:MAG: alanine racemase [Deltaproteobacteria bacterium]|nr:alanine racemase [Deltaproteobacteria bacterium]